MSRSSRIGPSHRTRRPGKARPFIASSVTSLQARTGNPCPAGSLSDAPVFSRGRWTYSSRGFRRSTLSGVAEELTGSLGVKAFGAASFDCLPSTCRPAPPGASGPPAVDQQFGGIVVCLPFASCLECHQSFVHFRVSPGPARVGLAIRRAASGWFRYLPLVVVRPCSSGRPSQTRASSSLRDTDTAPPVAEVDEEVLAPSRAVYLSDLHHRYGLPSSLGSAPRFASRGIPTSTARRTLSSS